MPLLKAEADKLSNNELVSGVIEEIIERDDLFAVLPFVGTNGKAYVYNRETADNLTTGTGMPKFADPNDTVVEGAASFEEITTRLRILIGDVDVDKFLQETESDVNNQKAEQIKAKAKALARLYRHALVNGNATTDSKQFDGLIAMTTTGNQNYNASQTIAVDGALTLSKLDELLDAIPYGANCIMMHPATIRSFRTLMRAAGGTTAAEYMMPAFGRPMLTHNGVPIITNEYIPNAASTGSYVFAMRLNESDGLHGLYGGASAGIRVEDVGTVQNKDATRIRLKWYAGLALKSTRSLAVLTGVGKSGD